MSSLSLHAMINVAGTAILQQSTHVLKNSKQVNQRNRGKLLAVFIVVSLSLSEQYLVPSARVLFWLPSVVANSIPGITGRGEMG